MPGLVVIGFIGQVWTLAVLVCCPPLPTPSIMSEFSVGGRAGGLSGCSDCSGHYAVDSKRLSLGQMISGTMMTCEPAIMEQENAYPAALETADFYTIEWATTEMHRDEGAKVADSLRTPGP